MVEQLHQLGPIALRPGNLFLKEANAADRAQRRALLVEVLALSGNAGIADHHAAGFLSQVMSHETYHLRQKHATRKLLIFQGRPICCRF